MSAKRVRITMPDAKYEVVAPSNEQAAAVNRLTITKLGPSKRLVWKRGDIAGSRMETVLLLAGFDRNGMRKKEVAE